MRVHTIIGAQAAYACIKTPSCSLDVRLEPGRSAAQSLREWADEQKAKADRLDRLADLARQAAKQLEENEARSRWPA